MNEEANPRISALLRWVTWLEVLILFWAGLGLLFYPPLVKPFWPWPLTPFNLRFLGAIYTAALIAAFLQALSGRWSPARVVTAMIFIFTLVVTLCSFAHLDRFDPQRAETWIWFVLYVGVCLNAGGHLWIYRRLPVPQSAFQARGGMRVLLCGVFILLGAYGVALLLAPSAVSGFWPWKLDAFHAQLYSVTFLTPALGAWMVLRGGTRGELQALGWTLGAWGALPIAGLVLAHAATGRVVWDIPGTWLWLALFAVMTAAGGWIIGLARKQR
ncbi:hypothetical protein BH11PSE11_BH11PSE11_02980 [soil metagenome]